MNQIPEDQRVGGIVLCGGQSRRMGRPKALLPFGPELMLERVVRILAPIVQPIVVVGAVEQPLLPLQNVRWATDRQPGRGPLEGLAAGFETLGSDVSAAYATSCDVPLLNADFVKSLILQLQSYDAVVPVEGELYHPLAAVYRASVLPVIQQLLVNSQLRPVYLFDHVRTKFIDVEALRSCDPELRSLMNLNQWDDYLAALKIAGFMPLE
jgi:molybdopterin-guanine dinucleotide biosynthesis protein A